MNSVYTAEHPDEAYNAFTSKHLFVKYDCKRKLEPRWLEALAANVVRSATRSGDEDIAKIGKKYRKLADEIEAALSGKPSKKLKASMSIDAKKYIEFLESMKQKAPSVSELVEQRLADKKLPDGLAAFRKDINSAIVGHMDGSRVFIVRREPKAHLKFTYIMFRSEYDFDEWNMNLPESHRFWHEHTLTCRPQKLRVDIDGKIGVLRNIIEQYPESVLAKCDTMAEKEACVITAVKNILTEVVAHYTRVKLENKHFVVCSSTRENKLSVHVIVTGYHLPNVMCAKFLARKIKKWGNRKFHGFADIYDVGATGQKNGGLRMAGHHKVDDGGAACPPKRIISGHTWHDSLISHFDWNRSIEFGLGLDTRQEKWEEEEKRIREEKNAKAHGMLGEARAWELHADKMIDMTFPGMFYVPGTTDIGSSFRYYDRIGETECPLCKGGEGDNLKPGENYVHKSRPLMVWQRGRDIVCRCLSASKHAGETMLLHRYDIPKWMMHVNGGTHIYESQGAAIRELERWEKEGRKGLQPSRWSYKLDKKVPNTRRRRDIERQYMPLPVKAKKVTHITEKELPDLDFADTTALVIRSPVGTGKSKALRRFIEETKPPSILIVSFRRTFTNEQLGKLKELIFESDVFVDGGVTHKFVDYQTLKNTAHKEVNMDNNPYVVCQYESMGFVRISSYSKTLLVLDESESIIAQMENPCGSLRSARSRWLQFQRAVRQCKAVVAMDGFVGQRTLKLMDDLRPEYVFVENTHQPWQGRKVIAREESHLIDSVMADVKECVPIVVLSNSKKWLDSLHEQLRTSYHLTTDSNDIICRPTKESLPPPPPDELEIFDHPMPLMMVHTLRWYEQTLGSLDAAKKFVLRIMKEDAEAEEKKKSVVSSDPISKQRLAEMKDEDFDRYCLEHEEKIKENRTVTHELCKPCRGHARATLEHMFIAPSTNKLMKCVCKECEEHRAQLHPECIKKEEAHRRKLERTRYVKYYCGDSDNKAELLDVEKHWDVLDVLLYSPSVSAGCSFEKKHFERVYCYFDTASCDVLTMMQMMARVRHVGQQEYIFTSSPMTAIGHELTKLSSIEDQIIKQYHRYTTKAGGKENASAAQDLAGYVKQLDEAGNGEILSKDTYYWLRLLNWQQRSRTRNRLIHTLVQLATSLGAKVTMELRPGEDESKRDAEIMARFREMGNNVKWRKELATGRAEILSDAEYNHMKKNPGEWDAAKRLAFDRMTIAKHYKMEVQDVTPQFIKQYGDRNSMAAFISLNAIGRAEIATGMEEVKKETTIKHERAVKSKSSIKQLAVDDKYRRAELAIGMLGCCGFTVDQLKAWEPVKRERYLVVNSMTESLPAFIKQHHSDLVTYCGSISSKLARPETWTEAHLLSHVNGTVSKILGVHVVLGRKTDLYAKLEPLPKFAMEAGNWMPATLVNKCD